MRVATIALLALLSASSVNAQAPSPANDCYAVTTGEVKVSLASGDTVNGTLLCLGTREVVLATSGRIEKYPLGNVRRIVKPADTVVDGLIKGLLFGIFLAASCSECDLTSSDRLGMMGTWAAIGAGLDALNSKRRTVFQLAPAPMRTSGDPMYRSVGSVSAPTSSGGVTYRLSSSTGTPKAEPRICVGWRVRF